MILTLCYVYATVMQWWRLRTLAAKLKGTLSDQNALLVCASGFVQEGRKNRSLENLLLRTDTEKIACTIVPKQKLNLNQWIAFPRNLRYFPIYFQEGSVEIKDPNPIYIQVQALLNHYHKHQSDLIQIENYGEMIGWRVGDHFEVLLKTDINFLAKLINYFTSSELDINHDLKLLKIETVETEGCPTVIKYEKKYLKGQTLKYSYVPVHWNKFVTDIKELYAKIRDITNPKIKIENGTTTPTPIKPKKKTEAQVKNTLDVTSGEHRRHRKPKPKPKMSPQPTKPKRLLKQTTVKDDCDRSKPPNILVYSDNTITRENVKRMLFSILNKEKYTIYDFPTKTSQWERSTILVVICGNVTSEMTSDLIQYFLNGGHLLCICSDLMYSVLHTYTTAEVREHELVRFTYGDWRNVKMMHHVFCYQASPAKKQFSKDSDQSNHSSNGSSPLAPRAPSCVELKHNDRDYNVQVQVLGTEETWQTPSLMLAEVKGGTKGKAVFSQVHLEIEPDVYENDEEKFKDLIESNEARIEILRDILDKHLEIECDRTFGTVEYTPGYFLGRYDSKLSLLSDCENIANNQLTCDKLSVVFCGHNVSPGPASNIRLPVLIHSCPQNFSTLDYYETLKTEHIGRLVIYTDIMTSSQFVLNKKLRHGLVVIARQQTNGVGRANNTWLSPIGCAAFSLQMHVPLHSNLGKNLSILQHLVMVAVITAVKTHSSLDLSLGIKWPNDLYVDKCVKIGGLIINSTIFADTAIVNIGCGINLSNRNPTMSLNDLLERQNSPQLQYEQYFAIVFNEIERMYSEVQNSGTQTLFELYYKYWLHNDAEITIQNETGDSHKKAKVVGIDSFGFLRVQLTDGHVVTVQPDGNSFDMMNGLIAPKKF